MPALQGQTYTKRSPVLARGTSTQALAAPSAQRDIPILRIAASEAELNGPRGSADTTLSITSADSSISYLPGVVGGDNTSALRVARGASAGLKPSYELELNSAVDLLSGMGIPCASQRPTCAKTKRYRLLANAADRSLLRNWSAGAFGSLLQKSVEQQERAGVTNLAIATTPRSIFVELFVNNTYEGCYQLLEEPSVTGLSSDVILSSSFQEMVKLTTPRGNHLLVASSTASALATVRDRIAAAEDALYRNGGTSEAAGLDERAAVDAFLLQAVMGSTSSGAEGDGLALSETRPGSALALASLLEFETSAGNDSRSPLADPTSAWLQNGSGWFARLYSDASFRAAVTKRWNQLKQDGALNDWIASISSESTLIDQARTSDLARWPVISVGAGAEQAGGQDDATQLLDWFMLRVGYLDALLNGTVPTRTVMLPPIGVLTQGAPAALSVRVSGESPTGSVTFLCGQASLGQAVLDGSGTATVHVAQMPAEDCPLQVMYGGDATHGISGTAVLPSQASASDASGSRNVETAQAVRADVALTHSTANLLLASATESASPSVDASNSQKTNTRPKRNAAQPSAAVSNVQNLGAITTTQVLSGLGWNVSPSNPWEFQAAAAAGAKHVRFQCSWGDAYGGHGGGGELQSPPPGNVSQGYQMPAGCAQGIALSKQYGMKPTILAAYGPPYQQILTLTTSAAIPAGSTSLPVNFVSGVGGDGLSTIAYPYDYISAPAMGFLSPAHSYAGTLISGVNVQSATHATVSLASATQTSIPAGTTLIVNRVLYPSAASSSATDPSIQAYVGFVRFLGTQCATAGIACEIEIWNEPAWPDECWDNRIDCFDQNLRPTLNQQSSGPNWGFIAALQSSAPIPGVNYDWAGTHKTGDNTVLGPNMQQFAGVAFAQPNASMTVESFHPYGNNPEDNMWNEPCLVALKTTWNWTACNSLPSSSSNADEGEARAILARQNNASYGIAHGITETGFAGTSGDDAHKARFVMRQFLGFMAANVQFVEFYRMYDMDTSTNFSFMKYANGTPTALPAYTALAGLMSDLAAVRNAPVTPISAMALPTVASYSGTYDLNIEHIVGARPSDSANSDVVTLWQRSYTSSNTGWGTLPSPAPAPVTLNLPSGMSVAQVTNLMSRAAVPFTATAQQVTFNVSDDPIEVLVQPAVPAPTVSIAPVSIAYGTSSASVAASVTFSGSAAPTGAFTFSIDGGAATTATCSGSTSPLTCTAAIASGALLAGSHTLTGHLAADANYGAASGSSTLTVTQQTTTLSIAPASVAYGTASATVSAALAFVGSAAPTGAVTITVDGGAPTIAVCTGSTSPLNCTANVATATLSAGSHVLKAAYAGDAQYGAATANSALTVAQQGLSVSVAPVSVAYGTASASLVAKIAFTGSSVPTGSVAFTVDGGAPTASSCTGTASPLKCTASVATASLPAGSHAIAASIAADTNYSGASGSSTLTVTQQALTISASSSSVAFGSSFVVLAAKVSFTGSAVPSGLVSFAVDNGTPVVAVCVGLGSPLACTATVPTGTLSPGSHSVAVSALADANYGAATASSTLTVSQASAAVTVAAGSVSYGTSSTVVSGKVNFTGSVAPSGALSFSVDAGSPVAGSCSGTSSPISCTASVSTSALGAGAHTITANLAADSSFAATSASGTLTVTVQTPGIGLSPVSIAYGASSAALAAKVTYTGAAAPTGTVSFSIDGGASVAAVCSGSGSPLNCTASAAAASLAAGTHQLTATLAADKNYGAASASASLNVSQSSASVVVSPMSIAYGTSSSTLSAKISYTGPAAPTGAFSFALDGGASLAAACVGSTSPLTCTAAAATGTLAAGSHNVTGALAADTNYAAATSSAALTVSQQGLALSVLPVSVTYGTASSVITAKLTYAGSARPTGAVTLTIDGGAATPAGCTGSSSPLSCTASVATGTLNAGTHAVAASVAGDTNYSAASATSTLTISPQTVALAVAPVALPYGTVSTVLSVSATFTGPALPSGAVSFAVDGGTPLPASCAGTGSPMVCTASAATASLSSGSHTLSASFAGDPNYSAANASGTLTISQQNVTLVLVPTTINYGANTANLTAKVTFSASSAPTGALLITVDGGSPVAAMCSGSSSPLTCAATVATGALNAGSHNVSATLAADANYSATSASGTLAVVQQVPTLVLAAMSQTYGTASATLSGKLSFAGSSLPTGAFFFTIDGGPSIPAMCSGSGSPLTCSASASTATLAGGSHALAASFAGDSNYAGVTGASTLTVSQQNLALAVTPVSIACGTTSASLSASITYSGPAAPAGALSFTVDGGSTVAGVCSGTGSPLTCTSSVNTGSLAAGSHSLVASLSADTNYNSANAHSTLSISQQSLALSVNPVAIPYGTSSTIFSAKLSFTGTAAPSGAVLFTIDGSTALPATCTGNSSPVTCTATASTATVAAGTHNLSASVAADSNYGAATASSTLTVSQQNLVVSVNPVSITYGTNAASLRADVTFTGPAAPSGVLSFAIDGGSSIAATCTGTTSVLTCTGKASTGTLTAGNHTLLATLAGDSNYGSASGTSALVVTQASLSLSLTPVSIPYGTKSAALTAGLSFAGSVVPSGPVSFSVDASSPVIATCSGNVSPVTCMATAPTATLSAGTHVVSVSAASDANYGGATASSMLGISPQGLAVAVLPSSVSYGSASATLTATVSFTGTTPPTGALTFSIDSAAPLTASCVGTASPLTCSASAGTANLAAGSHTVTAALSGDSNYSSASSSAPLTVTPQTPALSVAAMSVPYGTASLPLSAKLSFTGSTPPTGNLLFSIDAGTTIPAVCAGTASPLNCSATVPTGTLAAGTHAITASIAAQGNFAAATNTANLMISQQSLAVLVAPVAIPYGTASAMLSAKLTFAGSVPPTGTLAFVVDGGVPVSAVCVGGASPLTCTASVTTGALDAGNHTLTATIAADGDFTSATANASLTVAQQVTTVALDDSASTISQGQNVTVNAVVNSAVGTVPGGTVALMDGNTQLATSPLAAGTATFSMSALSPGLHTIRAVYSGTSDFASSTSTSVNISVSTLDFSLVTTSAQSLTVTSGATAVYSLKLTPLSSTYPGMVKLSLQGLPAGVSYVLTPDTVGAAAGVQTITLTVHAPATQVASAKRSSSGGAAVLMCFLGLPLAGLKRIRRAWRQLGPKLALVLLVVAGLCAATGLTGCGGVKGVALETVSYSLNVTAVADGVQHTAQVSLNVE